MSPTTDPQRIVSLLPGATETLYALGLGPQMVGRSHECDWPPAASRLKAMTSTRIDATASSREIDRQVKRAAEDGHGPFSLDAAAISAASPTVIVTQELCDVCAVTPKDLEQALEACDPAPQVIELSARSFEGVMKETMSLARTLGVPEAGLVLVMDQWRVLKQVRKQVEDLEHRSLAVLDWVDPLMFAGNWIPELAEVAGCSYPLVDKGQPSRWGSWEELGEHDPEVLVVAPCGRRPEDTVREWDMATSSAAVAPLSAVESRRAWAAEGHHYFNRAGPRLAYSAALLARAAHEEVPELPPALEEQLVSLGGSKA